MAKGLQDLLWEPELFDMAVAVTQNSESELSFPDEAIPHIQRADTYRSCRVNGIGRRNLDG